jgi:hypothetical protein
LFWLHLVISIGYALKSQDKKSEKPEESASCAARQEASEKGSLVLLTAPGAGGLAPGAGSCWFGDFCGKYIFLEDTLTWICFILK